MQSTKKFSYLFFGLIGVLFPFMTFAAPKIQLEANANSVGLDEPLLLYVTIQQDNASDNTSLSTPEILGLEPFRVVGRSSSTNMQIINGVGTATREQQLRVMPQKVGTFTIGPVKSEYGEETVQSNTIEVSVIPSPTETLKQSLLEDSTVDKAEILQENQETRQDSTPSIASVQPLGDDIKVSDFSSANGWFWSFIILLLVTLGGGILIGKNLVKRS